MNEPSKSALSSTPVTRSLNCRADFPALDQKINDHPLVYLDSAASSQQPATVIDAISAYQRHDHANVHRGPGTNTVHSCNTYLERKSGLGANGECRGHHMLDRA